ncbi:TRAP transporter small permease [Nocardioides insulae]|uniref:TRAP transporter small permease n=1 Tax=Nocardioides insulae TaxID=394734 RepID=UPI00040B014B|nr:TRAP transporter small permease [Nocardioides insulae]
MSEETAATGPPGPLKRVVGFLTTVELGISALAAAMIFVLILVQAGQRYLPIDGWTWTGELARYGLVWLTFSACGVLVTRDGHIALQLVDSIRNQAVVRSVHVFALLVVAATGAGFAWACWTLITESQNLTTPSLGMPMWVVYLIPLIGFVSTTIRGLCAAIGVARHGVGSSLEPESLAVQVNGPQLPGGTADPNGEAQR